MSDRILKDSAGTPAEYGDTVQIVKDKLGQFDASQPNASLKPVLGRVPVGGRRNLLSNSFDLNEWRNAGVTVSEIDGDSCYFETDADTNHSVQAPGARYDGKKYTRFAIVKPIGRRYVCVCIRGFGDGISPSGVDGGNWNTFDTIEGRWRREDSDWLAEHVSDGFWMLGYVGGTSSNDNAKLGFSALDTNNAGIWFPGDPEKGLIIRQSQYELGDARTPYQRVTNPLDITEEGADTIEYLRFDGVDDRMSQTFPDAFEGDLIVCGTKGSWVDEAVSIPAGGELTIGPKNLPNTPNILPALGDIIGWVPVGRTTTEEERQRIIEYYKGRGAKGRLVPSGVELVTNGTFDTDTDWVLDAATSISNGKLSTNKNDAGKVAYQTGLPILEGKAYRLVLDVISINAELFVPLLNDDSRSSGVAITSVGTHRQIIVAASSGNRFQFNVTSRGVTASLDNISLQELIPEEDLT